jgi:hypothetical protein
MWQKIKLIFENTSEFRYVETVVASKNSVQGEINCRLTSGNAFYHVIQHLLSSNVKSKIYKTVIFSVFLCRCQT